MKLRYHLDYKVATSNEMLKLPDTRKYIATSMNLRKWT